MSVTRTKFKAKIVSNFTEVMKAHWESENDVDYSIDSDFRKLAERISGKYVTLVRWEYSEGYNADYFEEIDDNMPLPKQAFVLGRKIK